MATVPALLFRAVTASFRNVVTWYVFFGKFGCIRELDAVCFHWSTFIMLTLSSLLKYHNLGMLAVEIELYLHRIKLSLVLVWVVSRGVSSVHISCVIIFYWVRVRALLSVYCAVISRGRRCLATPRLMNGILVWCYRRRRNPAPSKGWMDGRVTKDFVSKLFWENAW